MNKLCPHLPLNFENIQPGDLLHMGSRRDTIFYEAALKLTQWYIAKDQYHKALLSLNRASSILEITCPFEAFDWVLKHYDSNKHIGNPVRHFQHLASRIDQTQKLRVWRAWACFHLAEKHLDQTLYQRDLKQIKEEGLAIPKSQTIAEGLDTFQFAESSIFQELLKH